VEEIIYAFDHNKITATFRSESQNMGIYLTPEETAPRDLVSTLNTGDRILEERSYIEFR